jgi:EAL domain-containing protein (putative c-di-GMP-specific phosphodiesterase class I)
MQRQGTSSEERELQRGVDHGEFHLAYQPIVSLGSSPAGEHQMTGVEALLRWEHPTRGLLWPSEFLPDAQQEELGARIGRWVIQTAVGHAAQWRRRFPDHPLTVAVNVSCSQLSEVDLNVYVEHLERLGLPTGSLVLEVGETELFDHVEQNRRRLTAARALGFRVVLDDLGSATVVTAPPAPSGPEADTTTLATDARDDTLALLASLEGFPVDGIKLDRNLVAQLKAGAHGAAIVEGVIRIAHRCGFQTIAEGVETRDEATQLASMGCDLAQGYLFHRPQAPEYVDVLLREAARANIGRRSTPEVTSSSGRQRG